MGSFNTSKSKSKSESVTTKDPAPNFNLGQYGSFTNNKDTNTFDYKPNFGQDFYDVGNQANSSLSDVIGSTPTDFSFDDVYNNPYYNDYKSLLQTPINQKYQQDSKELQNQLAARNQVGGSAGMYANSLLNNNYNSNLLSSDNQARLGSADAAQSFLNNKINLATTLQNLSSANQNQYFQPMQIALSGLGANAPYVGGTTTGTQTNTSNPSFMSNYLQYMQAISSAAGSAAGAGAKGA